LTILTIGPRLALYKLRGNVESDLRSLKRTVNLHQGPARAKRWWNCGATADWGPEYLGSHSLHLDRNYYNNTPLPGPGAVAGRRPNSLFRQIRPSGTTSLRTNEGASLVASAALLARLVVSGQLYVGAHAGRGRRLEQQRHAMKLR